MSATKEFENKRWHEHNQALAFRHAKTLEIIKEEQSVLDVGCGDGLLMEALIKKGSLVVGIDLSEEGVRKCKEKGLTASVLDVSSEVLPFQNNAFDTVVILDVLEHLYAPGNLMEEAKRVSKKNVIVGVPNFNSLPARIQVLLGRVPENNKPNKGHVYWFNERVLRDMMKQHGLSPVIIATNVFWEDKFLVGGLIKFLARIKPSLFSLSFVAKLEKNV